ncbi:MAG: hypothetical protein Q7S92_05750 [Candidatus Diapherotrites archaeon]|nr:hypothetical protein [Candidatus Diapherotrites archaeon]
MPALRERKYEHRTRERGHGTNLRRIHENRGQKHKYQMDPEIIQAIAEKLEEVTKQPKRKDPDSLERLALLHSFGKQYAHEHEAELKQSQKVGMHREGEPHHYAQVPTAATMRESTRETLHKDAKSFDTGARFYAEQVMAASLQAGKMVSSQTLNHFQELGIDVQKYQQAFARGEGRLGIRATAKGITKMERVGFNPLNWALFLNAFVVGSAGVPAELIARRLGANPSWGTLANTRIGKSLGLQGMEKRLDSAVKQAHTSHKTAHVLEQGMSLITKQLEHELKNPATAPKAKENYYTRLRVIQDAHFDIVALLGKGKIAEAEALVQKAVHELANPQSQRHSGEHH